MRCGTFCVSAKINPQKKSQSLFGKSHFVQTRPLTYLAFSKLGNSSSLKQLKKLEVKYGSSSLRKRLNEPKRDCNIFLLRLFLLKHVLYNMMCAFVERTQAFLSQNPFATYLFFYKIKKRDYIERLNHFR